MGILSFSLFLREFVMDTVDGEDGRGDILEYLEYAEAIGNRDLGDVKVFKWLQWSIVNVWLLCDYSLLIQNRYVVGFHLLIFFLFRTVTVGLLNISFLNFLSLSWATYSPPHHPQSTGLKILHRYHCFSPPTNRLFFITYIFISHNRLFL